MSASSYAIVGKSKPVVAITGASAGIGARQLCAARGGASGACARRRIGSTKWPKKSRAGGWAAVVAV